MNARGAASARRIPPWKYDENSIPGLSAICERASRFHNFKERKKNVRRSPCDLRARARARVWSTV